MKSIFIKTCSGCCNGFAAQQMQHSEYCTTDAVQLILHSRCCTAGVAQQMLHCAENANKEEIIMSSRRSVLVLVLATTLKAKEENLCDD